MQNTNEKLARYINQLKKQDNISYNAIAYISGCNCRTVRDFLKQIPTKHSYTRGIRLETANNLLKCFSKTWLDFHNFCEENK